MAVGGALLLGITSRQQKQAAKKQAENYNTLKGKLAETLSGTANLRAINSALKAANEFLQKAQADFDAAVKTMLDMQDSGAWEEDSETYQALLDRTEVLEKQIDSAKEAIKEIEKAR